MAKMGGNCGEPGHGLTGTTPLHAACAEEPEIPAIVYVSEVSHNFQGKAYCYGGGHYRRSHVKQALVGRSEETGLGPPSCRPVMRVLTIISVCPGPVRWERRW